MRHTFASLLLAAGEPITYVSRQLGHRDGSITLRVYAHWLPDTSARKGVDRLDDAQPSATPAQPEALTVNEKNQLSRLAGVVSLNFASWNRVVPWLRAVDELRRAA